MITNPEQAGLDFGPGQQYRVRRSKRARYLRINAHPDTGIEVVVPHRMSMRHVTPFVRQHQQWIDKQVQRLGLNKPLTIPTSVDLPMIGRCWPLRFRQSASQRYRLTQQENHLLISGPDPSPRDCQRKLQQWLRQQARYHLAHRLDQLSRDTSLAYNRLTVRTQRTRWGSCSSKGNISLNDRLLLLPPELGDYVMLHELCHTRHMNHSRHFWQLLETHLPEYRQLEKQLRQARLRIPAWA